MTASQGEPHLFNDAGWCPNNPEFPLLVYRRATAGNDPQEIAGWFERCFAANGWPPAWRYTIYAYPHFHSNTHEVVGVFRGRAVVRFGDSSGEEIDLAAGDAVLIPAGVSHQRIQGTLDFIAVGAYPEGFEPDQVRKDRPHGGDYPAKVRSVPRPPADPLFGSVLVR